MTTREEIISAAKEAELGTLTPNGPTYYAQMPTNIPGCVVAPQLTDDDVRRIVREELEKRGLK